MTSNISRRSVLAGLTLAPTILSRGAWAQSKELRIGIQGGLQGEFIRKNVIPQFESDFGCKVIAQEGTTLEQLARLRATKAAPRFTVMTGIDDLGVEIAKREDLIDPLPGDLMPNLTKVYPRFVFEDGYGVAVAVSNAGMFFDPTKTKALTSYEEMWDPKFAGNIMLAATKGTPSVFLLIVCASLVSGKPYGEAQYLIDELAWPKLEALKPNVGSLLTTDTGALLIAQGEALLGGIEYSKYVTPYTMKGASVEMCYPQEGAFAGVNCQVLVKGAPNPELGAEWMNRMLSAQVQQQLAEATLAAPSVDGLTFSPEFAPFITYPLAKMEGMKLFSPDWSHANPRRAGWMEQINRIFTV